MLNWRQNYHRITDPLEGSISQEHTGTVLFNDVNELVLFFFFLEHTSRLQKTNL